MQLFFFNKILIDPLEQFYLISIFNVLNNAVLWNIIIIFFCFLFFYFYCLKNSILYYVINLSYKFVKSLVNSQIENKLFSVKYVPIFYFLFLFIIFSNFFGVIPFVYTVTSLIVLPFFLSITFFGGSLLISIRKYKWNFFAGFLPSGVPNFIMPFLILIEFISYIMRIFSLAIRLFANMLSGHILIKILVSVAFSLINSFLIIQSFFFLIFFLLVVSILILEIIICLLQAYVFVSLSSMYLNENLNFGVH